MAGQIRKMIDNMVQQRAKGDPVIEITTRTKLLLKGIQEDKFTATSADDAAVIARLREVAKEIGVTLK
jgi:hypothetical protein